MIQEGTAMKIERDIIDYLDSLEKEKGLTDEKWGSLAFEGNRKGQRKVQNLKRPQANGLPQKLCVADFVRLCAPLGIDPAKVLTKALLDNNL